MTEVGFGGVAKRYGDHDALRDFTLTVRSGELLVLLGPSGSGKTTALRVLAGLEQPDAGRVRIGERDVTTLPPDERGVAMVFQSYALFPHLTVFDNLAFGLRARKTPDAEVRERVGAVASTLGIERFLERKPRQLSGGERQRVALGRAMIRRPDVFLMDEPLSNLDARLRVQTRAEIQRLQASLGTTTIYVTHDQVEALGLGHRIAVLDEGSLRQVGTPEEIYERPATAFVASFVGSPPMNVFPAAVATEPSGARTLCAGAVRAPVPDAAPFGDGEDVLVGIRPEHIHIEGSVRGHPGLDARFFEATVDVVENAGDQSIVFLSADAGTLAARVEPGFRPRTGEHVRAALDPRRVHVFERQGGAARWHAS